MTERQNGIGVMPPNLHHRSGVGEIGDFVGEAAAERHWELFGRALRAR